MPPRSAGTARSPSSSPPGRPAVAEVDPDAIGIVIDNLVRNAIDHSPAGHAVTVSVGAGAAVSAGAVSGPTVAVEDRGPGVPPELRTRIFEPFARGRATDRGAGTGLGLAICRRIVDGHGGSILVEDRPGGGARFVVHLPAPEAGKDGQHFKSVSLSGESRWLGESHRLSATASDAGRYPAVTWSTYLCAGRAVREAR